MRDWVYRKLIADPAAMSNLSKSQRQILGEKVVFSSAKLTSHQTSSSDGTQKLLLTWPAGSGRNRLMIPEGPRRTACVSSQVGCPVGCTFCASGIDGVKANLASAQIVEQVFALNRVLAGEQNRVRRMSCSWAWENRWPITPMS